MEEPTIAELELTAEQQETLLLQNLLIVQNATYPK